MEKELKRCPFCGGFAEIISKVDSDGDLVHGVRCINITCIGADIVPHFFDRSQAVKAWNRRASDGTYQD